MSWGGNLGIAYRSRLGMVRAAARIAPKHKSRIFMSRLNPRRHRWLTGGSWDTMGELQLKFLVDHGLEPEHFLLDIGCGGLRGGINFVRYLEPGHYFGVDRNAAFLKAGALELKMAGIANKGAILFQSDRFELSEAHRSFDFAIAQSLFTHLSFNDIMLCLSEVQEVLKSGGKLYATYFPNPGPRLRHEATTINLRSVFPDRDPYCYEPDFFRWAVEGSSLKVEVLGDWGHPRGQEMLQFSKI